MVEVRVATSSDADINLLLAAIESGIPKYRHEMAQSIREYHQFRDELYSVDGVVIYKDPVVIPPSLRNEVLTSLHAAHQGVTSMTARADRSICILAWHYCSHSNNKSNLRSVQPDGTIATQCTTYPNNVATISVPVHLCILLYLQRHAILLAIFEEKTLLYVQINPYKRVILWLIRYFS